MFMKVICWVSERSERKSKNRTLFMDLFLRPLFSHNGYIQNLLNHEYHSRGSRRGFARTTKCVLFLQKYFMHKHLSRLIHCIWMISKTTF